MKKTHLVIAVMAALFFALLAIAFFWATISMGGFHVMVFVGAFTIAFLPGLAAYSIVKAMVEVHQQSVRRARIALIKARRSRGF